MLSIISIPIVGLRAIHHTKTGRIIIEAAKSAIKLTKAAVRVRVITFWADKDTIFGGGVSEVGGICCATGFTLAAFGISVLISSSAFCHTFVGLGVAVKKGVYRTLGNPSLGNIICE